MKASLSQSGKQRSLHGVSHLRSGHQDDACQCTVHLLLTLGSCQRLVKGIAQELAVGEHPGLEEPGQGFAENLGRRMKTMFWSEKHAKQELSLGGHIGFWHVFHLVRRLAS